MTARFDLHTHSLVSDGTVSPADLAFAAAELGLAGFALTDHDTISGWQEAAAAAEAAGIEFLPGVEITTRHRNLSHHLLAYGSAIAESQLLSELAQMRTNRQTRVQKIVDSLAADYEISWEMVRGSEQTQTVGRPHIADALVKGGYFADRQAAFNTVLAPGSPYYVPNASLDTISIIKLMREAGAVCVLAHPANARERHSVPAAHISEFAAAGLWGLELDHPENLPARVPALQAQAAELGLEITGASDYHGSGKINRLGECTTAETVYRQLCAALG